MRSGLKPVSFPTQKQSFRVLNSAASYITEYREFKGDEWPAHLVPVNILELWQSLIDKYQDCGDEELDATLKAIIYEP